ncbi:MAG: TetR/AcrR family transcriptional regulator [Actinomycetota bacterium]
MARQPKFDDDEILDRAMTAFWRGGLHQTSIRDLERILDLKAPSIYRRWGTKDGLGAAVVDHYVDRVVGHRVERHLGGDGDPIDNLVSFLESSVTQSGDGGRLWGCLLTNAALEADDPDPQLLAALHRGLAAIEDGIRAEVDRAGELDRLAPRVDPAAAVDTLTLAMQGLMAMARGGASPTDLRRRARGAVALVAAEA